MTEGEKHAVGALVAALLLLAPGYLFHTSPRFAGSLGGGVLGMTAAALMVAVLVYPLAKYVGAARRVLGRVVSMRTLLMFHVYAGILGPLAGVLHSGHSYQSPLGMALLVLLLVVVLSGFGGRYYLAHVSAELREQQEQLAALRETFNAAVGPTRAAPPKAGVPLSEVIEGVAELEYAIAGRETLKRSLARWIVVHVVSAISLYAALVLHIWGEVYFGLRWLR